MKPYQQVRLTLLSTYAVCSFLSLCSCIQREQQTADNHFSCHIMRIFCQLADWSAWLCRLVPLRQWAGLDSTNSLQRYNYVREMQNKFVLFSFPVVRPAFPSMPTSRMPWKRKSSLTLMPINEPRMDDNSLQHYWFLPYLDDDTPSKKQGKSFGYSGKSNYLCCVKESRR